MPKKSLNSGLNGQPYGAESWAVLETMICCDFRTYINNYIQNG